jgi:hypothetical protein
LAWRSRSGRREVDVAASGLAKEVRPEHSPAAGPLLVLGWPSSVGAGLLPEHDSAPLTELPVTREPPVLPLMRAGPPMAFPDTVTRTRSPGRRYQRCGPVR